MKKQVASVEEVQRKLESFCVYQDRCHKEVEKKLEEYNLIPEAKEKILLHLLQENYLNEERFAKSFARGKFRIKKWGRVRITRELKFRDISSYNIKTALIEIDEDEYVKTLYELVEKKKSLIKEINAFKKKKKIVDHLMYKGFESDLIFKTVNEIL
ncbi:recombinase RecX [Tenacibaculum holothuriorum]|uniref:Regulatory protein RecX n=1 Tax=Tenacibaculum holothuriorum TaxID=1635173 RepID=A0A1Y2PEN2_9FLAO|nr:regulatory protein RecX [Tenacibaculum holothuriorum]OSY88630.1 recombinase RecX [Tenacibaculum holothuriorum]